MIGAEGTKTPRKCYRIFFVRGRIQGSKIKVLREDGAGETPQTLKRRGGSPDRPKVREVPRDRQKPPVPAMIRLFEEAFLSGAEINRQV